MPDTRLQLIEEFGVVNLLEIIVVRLFCVFLNAVVQVLTKVFGSCFFELTEPQFNVFNSLVNDVLQSLLRAN